MILLKIIILLIGICACSPSAPKVENMAKIENENNVKVINQVSYKLDTIVDGYYKNKIGYRVFPPDGMTDEEYQNRFVDICFLCNDTVLLCYADFMLNVENFPVPTDSSATCDAVRATFSSLGYETWYDSTEYYSLYLGSDKEELWFGDYDGKAIFKAGTIKNDKYIINGFRVGEKLSDSYLFKRCRIDASLADLIGHVELRGTDDILPEKWNNPLQKYLQKNDRYIPMLVEVHVKDGIVQSIVYSLD